LGRFKDRSLRIPGRRSIRGPQRMLGIEQKLLPAKQPPAWPSRRDGSLRGFRPAAALAVHQCREHGHALAVQGFDVEDKPCLAASAPQMMNCPARVDTGGSHPGGGPAQRSTTDTSPNGPAASSSPRHRRSETVAMHWPDGRQGRRADSDCPVPRSASRITPPTPPSASRRRLAPPLGDAGTAPQSAYAASSAKAARACLRKVAVAIVGCAEK